MRGSSRQAYRNGPSKMHGEAERSNGAVRIFPWAFLLACFVFWWLPSVLYRMAGMEDPIRIRTVVVSLSALAAFAAGYLLRPVRSRGELPASVFDRCQALAWRATVWLTVPALALAIRFFHYRSGIAYGEGQGLSTLEQAVFYAHMYFGFLFLGAAKDTAEDRRRALWASLLVILPRVIVSLRWGRFFVVQALAPILFIALARGWLRMSRKLWIGFACLGLAVVFVPSLTRGDQVVGNEGLVRFFAEGGTLKLFQDNKDLNLYNRCPPLLVSLTDGFVPYREMGVCTLNIWGERHVAATLDRILAYNDPTTEGTLTGPGANYILELYLSGGIGAILVGSLVFGMTCRWFAGWIGRRSLFAGIWAECLTRGLLAPRGTLGYVYQLIPVLVVATGIVILVAMAAPRRREPAAEAERVSVAG